MELLTEIGRATAAVTEAVAPAVVSIGRNARGTGVVVGTDRVVTNAHNLRDRTTSVTFADGLMTQATLRGVDVDGDLAVLDVDTAGAATLTWSDEPVTPGTAVFGVANPGGRGIRVTFGTVSAVGRDFRGPRGRRLRGAFEHTAPLGRGSSGGPVVDGEGRLLGLNTSRLPEGFYLALPADEQLRSRVDALARGESVTRPRLGVGLAPGAVANRLRAAVGLPPRDGLLVQIVEDGSPAAGAGIEQGDLLVAAQGSPLAHVDDLLDAVETAGIGGSLTLTVIRGVEERTVSVDVAPPDAKPTTG